MSGAFGWIRNDHSADDGASRAAQPATPAAPRILSRAAPAAPPPVTAPVLKSTAKNAMIIVLDATGSMRNWPQEIFRRLPLLHQGGVDYLGGDDLEILFIVMGDAKTDARPIQASRFGRGPELDGILAAFDLTACNGGGNGGESHELAAAYVFGRVDVSSARNVNLFLITDEPPFPTVNPAECRKHLGFDPPPELRRTDDLFAALRRRMNVHAILCATGSYDPAPIEARWRQLLGDEGVLRLDDHRRVVDVMLGTLAALTGQVDRFTQDLRSRQAGTVHGAANVRSVLASIALLGRGTPSAPHLLPKGMTLPLLPDPGSDS